MSCPDEVDEINVIVSGPYPPPCIGCGKLVDDNCIMYRDRMDKQWSRAGGCAGRTHNKKQVTEEDTFKVNPLKQSKRNVQKR